MSWSATGLSGRDRVRRPTADEPIQVPRRQPRRRSQRDQILCAHRLPDASERAQKSYRRTTAATGSSTAAGCFAPSPSASDTLRMASTIAPNVSGSSDAA